MSEPQRELSPLSLGDRWAVWPIAKLRTAGMPFRLLEQAGSGPGAAAALAGDERIAAAIAWQNEAMTQTWLLDYRSELRAGKDELRRRNEREVKLIQYGQRYCAKNETIGFFGPVSWALLGTEDAVPVLDGSPLTRRDAVVCVETNLVQAIVDHYAGQERLRSLMPLRRSPVASVVGCTLRLPPGREIPITADQAAVWEMVDGTRSADELASGSARYLDAVESLIAFGGVLVGPDVPMDGQPERVLETLAPHLPPADGGQLRLALGELAARRAELLDAVSAEDIAAGLQRLAAALRPILPDDQPAAGRRHFGRGMVYLETRSEAMLRIPDACVRDVGEPLALVLDTAAWLVREVGQCFAEQALRAHRRLALDGPVRLDTLLFALAGELEGAPGARVHEVVSDFQQRWLAVIGDVSARSVRLRAEEIAPMVRALFPAAAPGWAGSVQHSPDLLMRADPESGALSWVLGELHLACNTLENRIAFVTHPYDQAAMLDLSARDMRAGRVVTLFSRRSEHVTGRTSPPLSSHLPELYRYWCFSHDRTAPPDDTSEWASTQFEVVSSGDGLIARCPSWEAPLNELLGDLLSALVGNRFRPLATAPHSPRVTVDDLVIARERWRFPARELIGGHRNPVLAREHAADTILRAGAPRHVFAMSPVERKPVYVDLESPLLLRNLVHLARRADRAAEMVDIAEMLPEPAALWTQTDEGPLTAEIRLAVAQREPAAAPAWRSLA
jgi:Lantibiotic dehydratase, N terminus